MRQICVDILEQITMSTGGVEVQILDPIWNRHMHNLTGVNSFLQKVSHSDSQKQFEKRLWIIRPDLKCP